MSRIENGKRAWLRESWPVVMRGFQPEIERTSLLHRGSHASGALSFGWQAAGVRRVGRRFGDGWIDRGRATTARTALTPALAPCRRKFGERFCWHAREAACCLR
jgi:hypothetical protein